MKTKKMIILLSLCLALCYLSCDNNITSSSQATVTINYYTGFITASSALIEVDGGHYTTMSKNSTKEIVVDNGAALSASWVIYTTSSSFRHTKSTIAVDGMKWKL